jgi:hypothetical protein
VQQVPYPVTVVGRRVVSDSLEHLIDLGQFAASNARCLDELLLGVGEIPLAVV